MKNLNKNKILLLVFVLLSAILFAAHFFVYRELVNKSENIIRDLDYISSESSREVYSVSIKKQFQNLSPNIERVKNSIIKPAGEVPFIEELEAIAKNNNLAITNDSIVIENDPKQASSTTVFFKIKSTIKGSWSNTYSFLTTLESLPYKLKINSLSMTSSQADPGESGALSNKKIWITGFEIRLIEYK